MFGCFGIRTVALVYSGGLMSAHVLQVVGGVLLEQKRLILKVFLNWLTVITVAVVNSNPEQPSLDKVDGGTA